MTTYNVINGNNSGSGSLREAITLADTNPGKDTIFIETNLIELTESIDITDSVDIGTPYGTKIIQTGDSRIFNIDNGDSESSIDVSLSRLELNGGVSDAGGAIFSQENLSLTLMKFTQNTSNLVGGAVYQANGSLQVSLSDIRENNADYGGGGIYLVNSDYTISASSIEQNQSFIGGGLFSRDSSGTMFALGIMNNQGGGITALNPNQTSITNSTIVSNTEGNGINSDDLEQISLVDNNITNNTSPDISSEAISTTTESLALAETNRLFDPDSNTYLLNIGDVKLLEANSTYPVESQEFSVLTENIDLLTGQVIKRSKPVFEFINKDTGAQLFTLEENTKTFVLDNLQDTYQYEGEAFYGFETADPLQDIALVPVYRLYNSSTDSHFYTIDRSEVNYISEVNGSLNNTLYSPKIAFYTVDDLPSAATSLS